MAEAERIIGTPGTPAAPEDGPERSGAHAAPRPSGTDRRGAGGTDGPAGTAPAAARAEAPERALGGDRAADEAEPSRDVDRSQDGRRSEDAASAGGSRRIAVLFVVAALAYLLDVVSKVIVVAKLEHHASVDLLGEWLRLEAIRNPGAAFGMGGAFTVIFTVIAAAVIVVIVRLARKLRSLPWAIALGLLLGGALGNLTDRLFRSPGVFEGAVVDFIAPRYFAVFNLADSAIVCGGILIVLLSFRGLDPDGTVHRD